MYIYPLQSDANNASVHIIKGITYTQWYNVVIQLYIRITYLSWGETITNRKQFDKRIY